MSGGDLPEYIRNNNDADRLGLVGDPAVVSYPMLTLVTSYLTSLTVSITFTPVMWFMGTSRGYVV